MARTRGPSQGQSQRPLHLNVSADVAADGSTVYVINPLLDGGHPVQLYASTDGGQHFSARPGPCLAIEIH